MPWQSGHYYLFSELLIRAVVPAESGVFALYARHEEIFIGETADLREALLRLQADMLRFRFDRPRGFTFELCPSGDRLKRPRQLLEEHETAYNEQRTNNVLYG